MSITTISGREFNQNASGAKRMTKQGPVFITDRGIPAHVLMSIEDYRKLSGAQMSLAEALAEAEESDFDFEPPRVEGLYREADLS